MNTRLLLERALFTRRLADLTAGGLPLVRALDILRSQAGRSTARPIIDGLHRRVTAGEDLSDAVAAEPLFFGVAYAEMIRAGERSGALDTVLEELAALTDNEIETRQKIRAALAYPALLLTLAGLVCLFLTFFVVPRFDSLFRELGQHLPWPTRFLLGASRSLAAASPALAVAGAALIMAARKRPAWGRRLIQTMRRLPFVADAWTGFLFQRWTQMMAALLRNGVDVLETLRLSERSIADPTLREEMDQVRRRIVQGTSLSSALAGVTSFPLMARALIAAGEESGQLEETLERLSQTFRRESEWRVKLGLSLLEPALILALGFVVGFVALAMLLPIFEMSGRLP